MPNKSLRLHTDGTSGPYLLVEPSDASRVRGFLDAANIRYTVDTQSVRLDERSAATVFNFGTGADAEEIQRVLDMNG